MIMTNTTKIGYAQQTALSYIMQNPGVCTAQVDRARRTARGGHKWMYATVGRLIRRNLVTKVSNGARADLYITDLGCKVLARHAA